MKLIEQLWLEEGVFNVPSVANSMKRSWIFNPKQSAEFFKASGFPAHRESENISTVSCLGIAVCPTDIIGAVPTIVVNAIKFKSLRAFAYIIKKVLKRLVPSFAYGYSASAVVFVAGIIGISAAVYHGAIRHEGAGRFSSSRMAVDNPPSRETLAARSCSSKFQRGVAHQFFGSTFAPAKTLTEHGSIRGAVRWSVCDYCELAECSSDEGFSLGHNDGSFIVVSSGGSRLQPILAASPKVNEGGSNA